MDRSFLVGLIGSDLGPSLSPALHEEEADRLGVRYVYKRLDLVALNLGAPDAGALLRQAQRLGYAGLNVTHPAKQAVADHLDDLSPDAAALGAVNTVVFGERGAVGHNTDWSGFGWGLDRGLPDAATGHVVLLGAGGAGAAAAYALARGGTRRLTVVDPVATRAEEVAARARAAQKTAAQKTTPQETTAQETATAQGIAAQGIAAQKTAAQETTTQGTAAARESTAQGIAVEVARSVGDVQEALKDADGLVNASPVGMSGDASPLPPGLLRPDLWVVDVIYRPLETELLRQARRAGCRAINGGGMLVAQAAEAFRLITGVTPDLERMHRHFGSLTTPAPR